jgi:hypothetical protein
MEDPAPAAETIRITGRIEEFDYVRAQWLHLRPGRVMAIFGVLFLLMILAGGVVQLVGWARGDASASESLMLPFLFCVFLGYGALLTWRFKRSYRTYKAIQVPIDIEMSGNGFHAKSEHGESRLTWDMFRKYKESKRTLLLYQTAGLFHVLPKRLFRDAADVDRARELFARNVRSAT